MMSEAAVQSLTLRDFAFVGPIYRNNSGALPDETGRLVRHGLGNETPALNKVIKSSDLIGITPVNCFVHSLQAWTTLGVFTALECKPEGWIMRNSDERAIAQARFHDIVRGSGGFAGFVSHPNDIHRIIRRG